MNKEEGFVHYTDEFTYILDNKDIDQAKTIWRISKNEAPCFSETGINGEFKVCRFEKDKSSIKDNVIK
ncbi:hypothetical protein [Clostridium tertium]|uniref:hypothetical protein n=1 Tax=Clostridium tertium TaxID=1559 RepID=UPI000DCF9FBC|nr:hypothetical protein [Clostridium tertium]